MMSGLPAPVHRGSWLLRASLLGLELFVGVGAVYGMVMLVTDAWHLPVRELASLPLHSWVLPGVALLAAVAIPMLAAAVSVWRNAHRAPELSLVAGLLLAGWILFQLAVIGPQMGLQAVMLVIGVAIAALAWWWRGQPRRASVMRRGGGWQQVAAGVRGSTHCSGAHDVTR